MIFVTNDEQIKEACSGVNVDFSIHSLLSYLEDAEEKLCKIIGEASNDEILADVAALKAMRKAIVNLALDAYASTGAVQVSDSGIHVSKSDKLLPASDKKLLSFRRDAKERGWQSFEMLISIMEGRKVDFPTWGASEHRLNYLNTFFHSSSEFGAFSGVSISAHLFQLIRPQIAFVETDVLEANFGEALVSEIRAKHLANVLTPAQKKLLRYFLRIVGPLSVAEAIPYRTVQLDENGVYQSSVSTFGTNSDNIEGLSVVQQRILSSLMMKLTTEGEAMIVKARKWLNENAADFPEWQTQVVHPIVNMNDGDSNVYFM